MKLQVSSSIKPRLKRGGAALMKLQSSTDYGTLQTVILNLCFSCSFHEASGYVQTASAEAAAPLERKSHLVLEALPSTNRCPILPWSPRRSVRRCWITGVVVSYFVFDCNTVTTQLSDALRPPASVTVSMKLRSKSPEAESGAVKVGTEAVGSERVTGLPLSWVQR
jgi:hypothetical protein